ncbi:hypothetical protein [Stieleria mannarensis]|uniref:hypothetical protein n=1 Tax=Stieleria mannarensis TaxID=2755585 RepID=UPI0016047AE3|nr:hypothetical protein [Rhodopirellula sp. JC639]
MESRIEATHRLQKENRWEEASRARDQFKQQLRAEGRTRRESNDASWDWMISAYPPKDAGGATNDARPTQAEGNAIRQIPAVVDQDDQQPFKVVYWIHGMLRLMGARRACGQRDAGRFVDILLLSQCPVPSLAYLGVLALTDPVESLVVCETKFRTALARLSTFEPDSWLVQEIETCLSELPRLRDQLSMLYR